LFVSPAMADTITITSWPLATSRATRLDARLMRSVVATEVPPNFITRMDMGPPRHGPTPEDCAA
jgi:hypothetical protein